VVSAARIDAKVLRIFTIAAAEGSGQRARDVDGWRVGAGAAEDAVVYSLDGGPVLIGDAAETPRRGARGAGGSLARRGSPFFDGYDLP
jgi:hypothetical protein